MLNEVYKNEVGNVKIINQWNNHLPRIIMGRPSYREGGYFENTYIIQNRYFLYVLHIMAKSCLNIRLVLQKKLKIRGQQDYTSSHCLWWWKIYRKYVDIDLHEWINPLGTGDRMTLSPWWWRMHLRLCKVIYNPFILKLTKYDEINIYFTAWNICLNVEYLANILYRLRQHTYDT